MTEATFFPGSEQELFIEGPAGKLQLLTATPKENALKQVAIICHPHPQFGGTLQNKVVTTLHKAFQMLGMRTVRFNYRGVGESDGTFAEGIGETEDCIAVLDWTRKTCSDYQIYLAGFSFGAYVSYRMASITAYRERLAQLISITMPQYPELSQLPEPLCPWLLIQGEQDEVVEAQAVFNWVTTLQHPPTLIKMPNTSHFFHGKLVELRDILIEQLSHDAP